MPKIFYLSEVIKFAIEKEQESFELYQKLEKETTNEKIKLIFQRLAKEETKHKAFYADFLAKITPQQSPGVKEDEEYQAYMEELIASSRTIPPLASSDFKNTLKVLDYAIAREKDSVLFYSGLKNVVPIAARNDIDTIIREEERHAALLMKVKEKCL